MEFHANSFEEIADKNKQHGMEMFQQKDAAHLEAMGKMQELMRYPQASKLGLKTSKKNLMHCPKNSENSSTASNKPLMRMFESGFP